MEQLIKDYIQEHHLIISDASISKCIYNNSSKKVLIRDDFPGNDGIFLMPHTTLANYSPSKANLHSHSFFEIIYVYKGSAMQYTETTSQKLEEGSIFIMNTNFYHGISTESDENIVFNILIEPRIFNLSMLNLLSENSLFANFFAKSLFLDNQIGEYIFFPYDSQSKATQMLDCLIREWIGKQSCYQSSMISYLSLAFTELVRQQINYVSNNQDHNEEIEKMMVYINNHLENISLKKMAEEFHYSPEYLSKLFKKYFGKTFSSLLSDIRLEKAAQHLRMEDQSIDSIAQSLGYYDRSYFNRSFKKKYGVSPSQYASRK